MRRPVTIIRPAGKDRFGDPLDVDTEMSDTCLWVIGLPTSSDEQEGKQNRVSSRVTAYPMGETRVRAGDRIRVGDTEWQVDGDPARAESPWSGRLAGHQVTLERWRG